MNQQQSIRDCEAQLSLIKHFLSLALDPLSMKALVETATRS
jgi:hypothetical protein